MAESNENKLLIRVASHSHKQRALRKAEAANDVKSVKV